MKKSVKGLLTGVLTLFMCLFWTIGCGTISAPMGVGGGNNPDNSDNTISAVQHSTISASLQGDRLTVEWGEVPLATSYLVTYDDTTLTIDAPTTRAVFTDVVYVSGSLTVTIIARATGYPDSAATIYTFTPGEQGGDQEPPPQSKTLAKPAGLAVRDGQLTWAEVKNATSYTVTDGTKTVTVTTNSVDLKAKGLTVPTSGSITYTVIAKADGYTDSESSTYKYVAGEKPPQTQTLPTPTGLSVSSGKLTWSPVTNATSYEVSDGNKSATVTTNSIDLGSKGLTVPTSGSITYTVVAKASGYNDSAAGSYKYTAKPPQPTTLEIPVGLIVASGILSWSPVKDATSYEVSDGTKTATVTTNRIDLKEKGLNVPNGGSATYTVVAKASGYNDSPSASITHEFDHFHAYNSSWESNKTHHWNVITCGHSILIEDRQGYGPHEFGSGNVCSVCAYTRSAPVLDKYVTYGEYPQSLKAANVTLGATADSNGYYTGSDGAKYVKVTSKPYIPHQWFNLKFTNGEKVNADNEYFFKVEPIRWRVLAQDGENAFLFCDGIIDSGAFYKDESSREISGSTVYPSNYKHSDLRAWLNGTFYTTAFSAAQQQNIKTTVVDNSAATTGHSENIYACEDTQDKIFLLSNREVYDTAYGFIADGTESDEARMLIVSDYARATGTYTSDSYLYNGCGIWWLRSPMWDSGTVVDSGSMSGMVASSNVADATIGIAPAMWVSKNAF